MPLEIVRNDITKMKVDAIVNAANSRLKQGGGVCGAIFTAAGAEKLQAECDQIGHCGVGQSVITNGYALPSRYVIHAVGPIWQGGAYNEEKLLDSCYTTALNLALKYKLKSIAFPLISSGIFGYPKDQALSVAITAIGRFLLQHEMLVYLVVFDKSAYTLSDKLFKSIESYIDDNFVEEQSSKYRNRNFEIESQLREVGDNEPLTLMAPFALSDIDSVIGKIGESFSEMLLRLIDERGKSDAEIYKRANIERKLFSKIRSNPKYRPSKNTALALAIALELNLDQTADLLRRAGFALSPSSKFDLIVEYFIQNGNFNIFEINEALFAFDESLLGA